MSERYIDEDANEEVVTTYRWGFYRPEEAYCGFSFPVDKHGNLLDGNGLVGTISVLASKNFELCKQGRMPGVVDCGIEKTVQRIRLCGCGSLKHYEDIYDARGIFVTRVCDNCREEKLRGYRPEIFVDSQYDTYGECVEEDY